MPDNVCQKIKCPWFSDNHKRSWGCQRWNVAQSCPLLKGKEAQIVPTEYALYAEGLTDETITQWQKEIFRICQEDPKYADDREFLETHPGWFDDDAFKVGAIANEG